MFKVLIVDDDISARARLKNLIDWHKCGYIICGEATNGSNAIQLIENDRPDIVITDMSMPVMDGVELIEHIGQNHPGIKVVALSGYDDFEYVRNSMKKGAIDYILKHQLNEQVLVNVLKSIAGSIKKSRDEISQMQQIQEQVTIGKDVLKQGFINQLVNGGITDRTEIERTISSLGIELDVGNLALVIAEIDDFLFIKEKYSGKELRNLIQSFLDISQKILSGWGKALISHVENNRFVMIFSLGKIHSDLYIYHQLVSVVDSIKLNIKRFLNITASYSISNVFNDISETQKYYREAEKLLLDKFFKGKDKIIREETNDDGTKKKFLSLDIKDIKNLERMLKCLERQKVNEYIEHIFNGFVPAGINYKSVQMICAELVNIVNKIAREVGIDIAAIYSNNEVPYNELLKYETIMDMKQWISGVYERLITILESQNIKAEYSELTKSTIEYINRNYNRNISLNDAAEYLGVNSSYLSRVFKEECKRGFVEHLNTIRVEKAKQLIGNTKLKDIVNVVGFNNYNYFFKVFKDITGMTPVEYEETLK